MTFIEIMIVLVILGIFSVLAVPSMRGFHRQGQLAAAVREFALLARYARQQAVLRNRTTEMVIDFGRDTYRFVSDPARKKTFRSSRNRPSEMEQTRALGGTKKRRLYFKDIEGFVDRDAREGVRIQFYKNGSASAATIVVGDSDNRFMTIRIAGATGAVRVYAGLPRDEGLGAPATASGD